MGQEEKYKIRTKDLKGNWRVGRSGREIKDHESESHHNALYAYMKLSKNKFKKSYKNENKRTESEYNLNLIFMNHSHFLCKINSCFKDFSRTPCERLTVYHTKILVKYGSMKYWLYNE